jgi:hypothetical protein
MLSPLHHRQPFAVPVLIGPVHIVVVVLPVPGSAVVRRIDVNHIHAAFVAVQKHLKRMKIIRVDQRMKGFARDAGDPVHRNQRGIHRLPKALYHDEFVFGENLLAPSPLRQN